MHTRDIRAIADKRRDLFEREEAYSLASHEVKTYRSVRNKQLGFTAICSAIFGLSLVAPHATDTLIRHINLNAGSASVRAIGEETGNLRTIAELSLGSLASFGGLGTGIAEYKRRQSRTAQRVHAIEAVSLYNDAAVPLPSWVGLELGARGTDSEDPLQSEMIQLVNEKKAAS